MSTVNIPERQDLNAILLNFILWNRNFSEVRIFPCNFLKRFASVNFLNNLYTSIGIRYIGFTCSGQSLIHSRLRCDKRLLNSWLPEQQS
ncbi:hypothetical protein TorRG33x02_357190 [Trema orientale]|uniref:Uncharacterized protein n=1 Tax=Trema orientale TaxID=63057 RepID=A0A2P5A5S7_TREOI|nr:hypothetical protein TorRG33x02_357190 [Trema orientale]